MTDVEEAVTALTRTKADGRYELSGPSGTLTYEPPEPGLSTGEPSLSADGDLPPWIVARLLADDCRCALARGEDALWSTMEAIYRRAVP